VLVILFNEKVALMALLEFSDVKQSFLNFFLDLVAVKLNDCFSCNQEGLVVVDLVQ